MSNGFTEWDFSDDNELLGVYGRLQGEKISQLGLITLNKECFIVPVVEEEAVAVVVEEPSWWDEFSTWFSELGAVKRIRSGSIILKVVISVATVIVTIVSILLCLVCHLKAKQDKNAEAKEDIEKHVREKSTEQLQKKVRKSMTPK